MVLNKIRDRLTLYLPGYINDNLHPLVQLSISWWIRLDPEGHKRLVIARLLKENANSQPYHQPSTKVLRRIRKQIRQQSGPESKPPTMWPMLALQLVLALLVFILVWRALPPGIILEWSVQEGEPSKFLVYRAELESPDTMGADNFVLLKEIPAHGREKFYEFMDMRLIPGQAYIYRVEAVDQQGRAADTQSVIGQGLDVLPSQLAIIFAALVVAYVVWRSGCGWRNLVHSSQKLH